MTLTTKWRTSLQFYILLPVLLNFRFPGSKMLFNHYRNKLQLYQPFLFYLPHSIYDVLKSLGILSKIIVREYPCCVAIQFENSLCAISAILFKLKSSTLYFDCWINHPWQESCRNTFSTVFGQSSKLYWYFAKSRLINKTSTNPTLFFKP